jgi:CNT family concentrative nucleoside transporter
MRRLSLGIIMVAVLGIAWAAFPGKPVLSQDQPKPEKVAEGVVVLVPPIERIQSVLGIVAILGLAFTLSTDRWKISRRVLIWGLLLQWGFALVVLRVPQGRMALEKAGNFIKGVLDCAVDGAAFVFGDQLIAPQFDLRLMPGLKDVKEIPSWGKDLVIVADVDHVLQIRVFGGAGNVLVDTDETRLADKGPQIKDLRKRIEDLWSPHASSPGDRTQVVGMVNAIVGPNLFADGPAGFVFAFRVLPTVIFVAALFAVLYHIGIMQWVVRFLAIGMEKLMGASGAESLNVAASLFLGQTEAPLTIRPYLPNLTRSELLTVMTSGMAHVSGGVMAAYFAFGVEPRHILTAVIMTAPGTILLSKMLIPETGTPETLGKTRPDAEKPDANILDAASRGTREGLQLALNIAAMLISFLAIIALINKGLSYAGTSLQIILGYGLSPVAWLLGIAWKDCPTIGGLLGTRTVLNELIAYGQLKDLKSTIDPRSFTIATYALCGFANFSSIGIQLGGIGALAPERRVDLARLGFKALLAGTLANFLSACIAGILL